MEAPQRIYQPRVPHCAVHHNISPIQLQFILSNADKKGASGQWSQTHGGGASGKGFSDMCSKGVRASQQPLFVPQ